MDTESEIEELTGPAAQVQCGVCGEHHDYEGFESSEGEEAQDTTWEVGQSQYDKHSQRINKDTPLRGRKDGEKEESASDKKVA